MEEPVVESAPSVVDEKTPATEEVKVEEAKTVDAGAEAEPQDAPKALAAGDVSDDATEPATPPTKADDDTVKKATPGSAKDAGAKDDAPAKDAGADAKPASDPAE